MKILHPAFNFFILLILLLQQSLSGQNCQTPFSISLSDLTTTSVSVKWSDSNSGPLGWELEIVKKGSVRTNLPSEPITLEKSYVFTSLQPSTSYELYIRAVCSESKYSSWNIAVPFTTVLEIPTFCHLNIPLKDNGTETLVLNVKETGILGKDIFLKGIDLIVEHDWPADLKITLVSPQGQQLVLSNHNGTVTDDFGDILDPQCLKVTTFSPDACLPLKSAKPPYIGAFKPDGDIREWRQDTLSKGKWKLVFFDRALKDIGNLRYANIRFTREKCAVPANFVIASTNINSISLTWEGDGDCESVKISSTENGNPKPDIFIQCNKNNYTFNDLLPNSVYEFIIMAVCTLDSTSIESCTLIGNTSCETISMVENFDLSSRCTEGCEVVCDVTSAGWFNPKDDGPQDWLVWDYKTDTENTGPSGDINSIGKYIYVENNGTICGNGNEVVLQSSCIDIKSNISGCDMSFYYHMYGSDIQSLYLELSLDEGQNWLPIFEISGNQGDVWKRQTLSLQAYDGLTGIFRFRAISGNGPFADIALDQIEFYKSKMVTALNVYYPDIDGDGFGTEDGAIAICNSSTPLGYTIKSGDCDDINTNIFPGASEIQCNSIDENCNGLEDDQPSFNPITVLPIITKNTCNGSKDGTISLEISGGTPSYVVNWSNGMTGPKIENLGSGIYYASIMDMGGCLLQTPYYQIEAETKLNIILTSVVQPSCNGKTDGIMTIEHNSNNAPYSYRWSNDSTTKNLTNVPQGSYTVTVTDAMNCVAILENLNLTAKPSLISDIKSIKHPFCVGQNTGEITLFTINGQSPYSYFWETGQTSDKISGLFPGNYTCTVQDANNCKYEFTAEIKSPTPIEGKVISTENVRCFGESNGSIKINVKGGILPYSYIWNKVGVNTDDIFDLKAGEYVLTISDGNGCRMEMPPITISEPLPFNIKIDSMRPSSCILGKNGYISLNAMGGNQDYNYSWNHSLLSTSIFDDLISGNYSVTAYDKLGCKASIPNIFIPFENVPIDVSLRVINENKCYQEENGSIEFVLKNGRSPFDFNWSYGSQYFENTSTDTIKLLPSGQYTLTITDADGCVGVAPKVIIPEIPPLTYVVKQLESNICAYDSLGVIKIEITGGEDPVGILWNGGLFAGKDLTHLPNGTYDGKIIDANGCIEDILPINISSASDIQLNENIENDNNGKSIGKICISPSGGENPYIISWNQGSQNTKCLENLSTGIYQVMVTDGLNCVIKKDMIVQNISATINSKQDGLKIYPNPTSGQLTILSDPGIQSVYLFDSVGKMIKKVNVSEHEIIFHLEDLPGGVYHIQCNYQDKQMRRMVIKY